MKALEYQSKKWEKVVAHVLAGEKESGADYQREINVLAEECAETSDYYRMCVCITRDYNILTWEYFVKGNGRKLVETTYLAVKSYFYAYRMKKACVPTKQAYTNLFSDMEDYLCKAIAIDCFDEFIDCYDDTIMGSLYLGKKEEARKQIAQLPEVDERRPEVYYIRPRFLKEIYNALLDQEEELLKDELGKRVRKYRKNMIDYATVIDFTTIGLEKTAKKYGMNVDLNIVEIPNYLKEYINAQWFQNLKISFQDEIEKLLQL